MLYRKIEAVIEDHLKNDHKRILIVDGARRIGKTYAVRRAAEKLFPNYIEIDLEKDYGGARDFERVRTVGDFYLTVSSLAGERMGAKNDTVVFLDGIQRYPHLLTLLKFLREDGRYTYAAAGSDIGGALKKTSYIPMGSIRTVRMYPLDFEEFCLANGVGRAALDHVRESFDGLKPLSENMHGRMLSLLKRYLLVGGLPEAVNEYVESENIQRVRDRQAETMGLYSSDAAGYDRENRGKASRIYSLIPSYMKKRNKRVVVKDIDEKGEKTFSRYAGEFDYLSDSGTALEAKAVDSPLFPLSGPASKNLLKLYMNDVGLLSGLLYGPDIRAVTADEKSTGLGAVYENFVACELAAHGYDLFYFDRRNEAETDFLINDGNSLCPLPIYVKSGKDYSSHLSPNRILSVGDYGMKRAFVFSNEREITRSGKITRLPIYYASFLRDVPDMTSFDEEP